MTTLTRDDTVHDVEYVTKHEAQMEIDAANAKIAELENWKAQQIAAESEWDAQTTARLLGAKLGESCRKVIGNRVPELRAAADALANACKLCAAVIGPPDNVEWASIPDCDAAYAATAAALQAYHANYLAP